MQSDSELSAEAVAAIAAAPLHATDEELAAELGMSPLELEAYRDQIDAARAKARFKLKALLWDAAQGGDKEAVKLLAKATLL